MLSFPSMLGLLYVFRRVKKLIKLLLSERGCIQFDFRNAVAKKYCFNKRV